MPGIAGVWEPIAAETTATGYEVAWKAVGSNQFTVMNTDQNGNLISNIGVVSANSTALQSLESSFHQDLNGDGHIGVATGTVSRIQRIDHPEPGWRSVFPL